MVSNALYFLLLAAILFIGLMTIAVFLTYIVLKYLIDYDAVLKMKRRGMR